VKNLYEQLLEACQEVEECLAGKPDYTERFVKLFDMPLESSMEDVFNYAEKLVQTAEELAKIIKKAAEE
jgi:hypothetical protein